MAIDKRSSSRKTWGPISNVCFYLYHQFYPSRMDGWRWYERCAHMHTNTSLHGNFDDEITAIWQYILAEFQMAKIDTIVCMNEYAIHHVHIWESFYYWHISFCCVCWTSNTKNGGAFNGTSAKVWLFTRTFSHSFSFVGFCFGLFVTNMQQQQQPCNTSAQIWQRRFCKRETFLIFYSLKI